MKEIKLNDHFYKDFHLKIKEIQFKMIEFNTLKEMLDTIKSEFTEIYIPYTGIKLYGEFSEVISEIENKSFDIYFTLYSDKEMSNKIIKYKVTYEYKILSGGNRYFIMKIRYNDILS